MQGGLVNPPEAQLKFAIIGAGISGLSAANRLLEMSGSNNIPIDLAVYEAGNRVGGVICTRTYGDFILECGPDSFITQKPWALDLCKRLGLEDKLISTNEKFRRTYVAHQGKLVPLPDGFMMMAPTNWLSFMGSPLFTLPGKLRMALDLVLPKKKSTQDETLADFVTRRLGKEALDKIAQPMIGGIYTSDPQKLSLRATMPRFLDLEKKHGSVIRGLISDKKKTGGKSKEDSGARYSLFLSLRDGMQSLVDALANKLPPGAVRLETAVSSFRHESGKWLVVTADGAQETYDGLVIATQSNHAARMLQSVDAKLSEEVAGIPLASSAVLSLIYKREDIAHPLDGFGFVVPAAEKRSIIACTFSSIKFKNRSPSGKVIIRAFVGGALNHQILKLTDDELEQAARNDLELYLGIKIAPLSSSLFRYPDSMPQYHVGHLEKVERIEAILRNYPGLAIAGNAFHGVGIPDCIHSGEAAAESVFGALRIRLQV
jgi:protoporphyrinogen/coproporphyrinogen III oxidase